jgi:hypothetical protein
MTTVSEASIPHGPASLDILAQPVAVAIYIIIAGGIFGGWASYLAARPTDGDLGSVKVLANTVDPARSWLPHVVLGTLAAFVVPLFLSLIQSDLLGDILQNNNNKRTLDYFTLGGFCLIASFSSRAFMTRLTDKVLALDRDVQRLRVGTEQATATSKQAKATSEVAEETSKQAREISEVAEETAKQARETSEVAVDLAVDPTDASTSASDTAVEEPNTPPEMPAQDLSEHEKAVLYALWVKPRSRRLPQNIATDASLSFSDTKQALDLLEAKGLVEDLKHTRTGVTVYRRTVRGGVISERYFGRPAKVSSSR